MKAMDKTSIAREVESALRGVSFSRAEGDKAKVKTVFKDTAVTLEKLASLEKQVRSLTHELAVARNQTSSGNKEDVQRLEGELYRLNTRISELLRQSEIQKKQHADELALMRSRQQTAGNSVSAELVESRNLVAYMGSQMAAMAAARDKLQGQVVEEEDKRHAANRRADGNYALLGQQKELTAEANRKVTQLRASLKLEEYEGQNTKSERAKLRKQVAELQEENSRLAERFRDNEEDCERLSHALERTSKEFAAYKAQKERFSRWIHIPSAMMGLAVVALVMYTDAQTGHWFDSLTPAALLGTVVYALSHTIAWSRKA
jgi:chromosome segregation ATPase